MIDTPEIRARTDLLALAERDTALKRAAGSGGGEWKGACPFCGGRDRFAVQPSAPGGGRWLCRNCTSGKWQDAIAYVMRREGTGFRAACEVLGARDGALSTRVKPVQPAIPAYSPPAQEWQAAARQAVEIFEGNLWQDSGAAALEYLRGRGLSDDTIRYFRLGYSPGVKVGELWIPRGVVIPCFTGNDLWYLKVRALPGDTAAKYKYMGVKGNKTAAIFNGDELLKWAGGRALFVEGEFNAMIAWQGLERVLPVCSMGSAVNRPDLATWGFYLAAPSLIMLAYDGDPAGESGLDAFFEIVGNAVLAPLPEGNWKDANDFTMAGHTVFDWLDEYLAQYTVEVPIFD